MSRSQLDTGIKNRYNSDTDKLSTIKLGENYPRAKCNT